MWSISIILKHLALASRLHAAAPWLSAEAAYDHATAAIAAATDEVTAELLLGIAFVESRFDPTAVSWVERGRRRGGRFPSITAPAHIDPHTSLYCGPLQTFARSWRACRGMRDLRTAYAAGAAELGQWLRDRRVRGNTARALAGHGCGNHGVTTGRCNGYPVRVLWVVQRLRGADRHRQPSRRPVAST